MSIYGFLSWDHSLPLSYAETERIIASQRRLFKVMSETRTEIANQNVWSGMDAATRHGLYSFYTLAQAIYQQWRPMNFDLEVYGLWDLEPTLSDVTQARYDAKNWLPPRPVSEWFMRPFTGEAPEFHTYNRLIERIQALDVDMQRFAYIVRTTHLTPEGKLQYWERLEDVGEPKRLKVKSMAKYLRMMDKTFKIRDLAESAIQVISEVFGQNAVAPDYDVKLVHGADIVRAYQEEYFGSCMHESDAVCFYEDQPNVEMLTLRNPKTGYLKGRALVWTLVGGQKFLDRVYPSDGGAQIDTAVSYALEQGWGHKVEHCIDGHYKRPPGVQSGEMEVQVLDTGDYPYMDTFSTSTEPDAKGWLLMAPGKFSYGWQDQDGHTPWEDQEDMAYCEVMDRDYPVEDFVYIPGEGRHVSAEAIDEFYTVDIHGEYIHVDNAVELDNRRGFAEVDGEDVIESGCGNYFFDVNDPHGQIDQATAGDSEGEYFFKSDLVERNGELYWTFEVPEEEEDEETE